jgi:hypothetical protein
VGDVGAVKRTLKALCILWLAPIVGASCGDPSRSSGIEVSPPTTAAVTVAGQFMPLETVSLIEWSRWCATLRVGGVIAYDGCPQSDYVPVFAWGNWPSRVLLLIVDSDQTVSFIDGKARMLASSEHWVAAQLRSEQTSWGDVRFTVTSQQPTRTCVLTSQLFIDCWE